MAGAQTRSFAALSARLTIAAAAAGLGASISGSAGAADAPVPQAEQVDTASLTLGPHDVFIYDWVEAHAKDGKVFVVDADAGALKATVSAAFYANFILDPKGKSAYVAETLWSRGNRGDRQDILTVYDLTSLQISKEIKLPGRALITTKKQDADTSADGRYVYVFNMAPADSVIVVEPAAGKVVTSIDVPGCALVYPFGPAGFSSICADGSLATVTLDDPAKPVVTRGKPFFDPDKDPIFEHSPTDSATGLTYFISYQGKVIPTTLGKEPVFGAAWTLAEAAGLPPTTANPPAQEQWRPGGWQMSALHKASGQLFVLMHKGPYWMHKADGTEVWVFDTKSKKLLRKIALKEPSPMVAVSQDANPLLYVTTDAGKFSVYDATKGDYLRSVDKLGDNPVIGYVAQK